MWTKYDTFTPSQKKAEYERLKKLSKQGDLEAKEEMKILYPLISLSLTN